MTDLQRIEATVERLREEMARAHERASQEDITEALKVASMQVDAMFNFKGERTDPDQAMAWPREGVVDKQGNPITGVPQRVQDATYFLAGYRLMGLGFGTDDYEQEKDVITYLLILLDGLTVPDQPMRAPSEPAV